MPIPFASVAATLTVELARPDLVATMRSELPIIICEPLTAINWPSFAPNAHKIYRNAPSGYAISNANFIISRKDV